MFGRLLAEALGESPHSWVKSWANITNYKDLYRLAPKFTGYNLSVFWFNPYNEAEVFIIADRNRVGDIISRTKQTLMGIDDSNDDNDQKISKWSFDSPLNAVVDKSDREAEERPQPCTMYIHPDLWRVAHQDLDEVARLFTREKVGWINFPDMRSVLFVYLPTIPSEADIAFLRTSPFWRVVLNVAKKAGGTGIFDNYGGDSNCLITPGFNPAAHVPTRLENPEEPEEPADPADWWKS